LFSYRTVAGRIARYNPFNPLRDWLTSLKWDGVKRVDNWLATYANADVTVYNTLAGKVCLLQAVARAYTPGYKCDATLILEGDQDSGKSFLVKILGGDFAGNVRIDPNNPRDTIMALSGVWINELSEMEVLDRTKTSQLKAWLTHDVDNIRVPYATEGVDIPRQFVLIGTVNPDGTNEYLNDPTGNRRFLPVRIRQVKFDRLRQDRDQLFAEAYERLMGGEKVYIEDPDMQKMIKREQLLRQTTDPWSTAIEDFISENTPYFITSKDVWCVALGGNDSNMHSGHQRRMANCLKDMGYEPKVTKIEGRSKRGFIKKEYKESNNG